MNSTQRKGVQRCRSFERLGERCEKKESRSLTSIRRKRGWVRDDNRIGAAGEKRSAFRWLDLAVQRQALDVPVEGVERVVGGDEGAMRGEQRQADDVASTKHDFRFRLRREPHDAALTGQ